MTTASRISRTRATRLARNSQRVQARIARDFGRALDRFFRAQAIRAVAVFLDRAKGIISVDHSGVVYKNLDPGAIIPISDNDPLNALARPYLLQMFVTSSETAGELVGAGGLTEADPGMVDLLRAAARRIVRINDATREAVQRTLADGLGRGLSDFQIARGVTEQRDAAGNITREAFRGLRDVVEETYEHRADTIARTEIATASQEASMERYSEAGVTMVDIMDGPGCGWTFHDDPDVADGSRRTVGAVRMQPLSHPNCTRVALPVL